MKVVIHVRPTPLIVPVQVLLLFRAGRDITALIGLVAVHQGHWRDNKPVLKGSNSTDTGKYVFPQWNRTLEQLGDDGLRCGVLLWMDVGKEKRE